MKSKEQIWQEYELIEHSDFSIIKEKAATNEKKWKKAKLGKKRNIPFTRKKYVPAKRKAYLLQKNIPPQEITVTDTGTLGEMPDS